MDKGSSVRLTGSFSLGTARGRRHLKCPPPTLRLAALALREEGETSPAPELQKLRDFVYSRNTAWICLIRNAAGSPLGRKEGTLDHDLKP